MNKKKKSYLVPFDFFVLFSNKNEQIPILEFMSLKENASIGFV